jgi:hypothetical protein
LNSYGINPSEVDIVELCPILKLKSFKKGEIFLKQVKPIKKYILCSKEPFEA